MQAKAYLKLVTPTGGAFAQAVPRFLARLKIGEAHRFSEASKRPAALARCRGTPGWAGSDSKRLVPSDSVRPVSADAWGWRSPNPPGISRRLLVSDCHIPECICRMARPIVFRAKTDAALLVLTLMVVAERIASSFSRRIIKPASRKNAPCRFYAHHRGTGSGILDRNAASDRRRQPCISSI